jgi:toxin ParE1/3/4
MTVAWLPSALEDLLLIQEYIGQDNKRAAAQVANRLRLAAKRLAAHPEIGRAGRVSSTRELVVPGTPYILPYRVYEGRVEIIAVVHGAREWPEAL